MENRFILKISSNPAKIKFGRITLKTVKPGASRRLLNTLVANRLFLKTASLVIFKNLMMWRCIMCYLAVIAGGGIGALFRHLSIQFFNSIIPEKYAFGTLFVNCAGSLCMGFLTALFAFFAPDAKLKLFLTTGFLGGYTTFSTYSLETARYILAGNIKQAALNILANNILCILFVLSGMFIFKCFFNPTK
ncbi:MAG: fluoride efflux transporter CrcB [Spirochaetaceae bacterium]|nr:fluoride efflux transporter CrcB [Spirochaetaceae bacterium]